MIALLHIVLVAATTASAAPTPRWTPVGPPGGAVRALASDPTQAGRIYLGTAEGILYRSDNGGRRWQRLEPGFPRRGYSLDAIAVDDRGVVHVGFWEVHGDGGGVARSADHGRTFTMSGLEGESVRALAVAPSDARQIVAGTLTGVFLSRDGGTRWERITPDGHADLRNIGSLAVDPRDPRTVYVGTRHLAWKTVDGGRTWTPIHSGMIDDSHVMTLSVDPRHRQTLYATACTGIYRSTDAGTWTKLEGIPEESRRTPAFLAPVEDPSLMVAGTTSGLWVSRDGGRTWRCTTSRDVDVQSIVTQPDGSIILGTESGILRSTDRGRTWLSSNSGFSERLISDVLFDGPSGRVFVAVRGGAGAGGGVFASTRLPFWSRLGRGLEGRQVTALARVDNTILAGTDAGIFALRPDSAWTRWESKGAADAALPTVNDLLTLPSGTWIAATTEGVLIGSGSRRRWTRPAQPAPTHVYGLASPASDPSVVVAATRTGLLRSVDEGRQWTAVSPELEGLSVHAVAFVTGGDAGFATTSAGLFRSEDRGATWQRVNGGAPHSDLTGIVVHPDDRTIDVSDFTRGGIFRSVDQGATWRRIPTHGLGSDRVWMLAVDPRAPARVLAASAAGGLHLLESASVLGGAEARSAVAPAKGGPVSDPSSAVRSIRAVSGDSETPR